MSQPPIPPDVPAPAEPPPTRPVLRPIPRWVLVIGIPVMALVAVAAVWLLLGFGLDRDRLDAIRTGGTLGVGLGGLVVLWLAVRRQRSTELDLLQKYEAHRLAERVAAHNEDVARANRVHQEQVAKDAREDAAERRITELYTKAVEQLGSEKAPVRLGGLYALERLAQNNSRQRQPIVNVLCAYLRMPYTLPDEHLPEDVDDTARATQEQRVQEREVRLTAQRILSEHLHPGRNADHPVETFWANVDLDLTGATLIDFGLTECHINIGGFQRATFIGTVWFEATTFTEVARFGGATFTANVWFGGATFTEYAGFVDATFTANAVFERATFTGSAVFERATFTDYAWFNDVTFQGRTVFDDATFTGGARFHGATFQGRVPPAVARFVDEPPENPGT